MGAEDETFCDHDPLTALPKNAPAPCLLQIGASALTPIILEKVTPVTGPVCSIDVCSQPPKPASTFSQPLSIAALPGALHVLLHHDDVQLQNPKTAQHQHLITLPDPAFPDLPSIKAHRFPVFLSINNAILYFCLGAFNNGFCGIRALGALDRLEA